MKEHPQGDSQHYSSLENPKAETRTKTHVTKPHKRHTTLLPISNFQFLSKNKGSSREKRRKKKSTSQMEGQDMRVALSHGLTSKRVMRSLCGSLVLTIFRTLGMVSLLQVTSSSPASTCSSSIFYYRERERVNFVLRWLYCILGNVWQLSDCVC